MSRSAFQWRFDIRRPEKIAMTRSRLIEAGRRAFAAHGFRDTSMDDLTAAAGLTRGALHHHFGDKRGLLRAVVDQIDEEVDARLRIVGATYPDPGEALTETGLAYLEMALDPEYQRIVLLDAPAELGPASVWRKQSLCSEGALQAVQALIDDGVLVSVDAEACARLLNGAAVSAAMWIAEDGDPQAALARASQVFRGMVAGLLRAPKD